jgi:hypothetical protein
MYELWIVIFFVGVPLALIALGWLPAFMLAGIVQAIRGGDFRFRSLLLPALGLWIALIVVGSGIYYNWFMNLRIHIN